MRGIFALSALALFHSAHAAFREGTYSIGSATLPPSLVLTEIDADGPLVFSQQQRRPSQVWDFIPKKDSPYFEIRNTLGGNINCGPGKGSCLTGNQPQGYLPESLGDNKYELVAEDSGFFLRVGDNQEVYLAGWDQSPNEQFVLTSA